MNTVVSLGGNRRHSSNRYDWIPPIFGGKSLVTRSERHAAARACSSAASNDARSSIIRRYCISFAGIEKPERADETPGASEHRDEPALVERAVHDGHVVVAAEVADALDLAVVLVGPHERHRRERLGRGAVAVEQAARRRDSLLGRVRPVLEPHQLTAEQRVRPARDVAGGDHARRREQRGVAHDAVVELRDRTLRASP